MLVASALACTLAVAQSRMSPDFENGSGERPAGWRTQTWQGQAQFAWTHEGRNGRGVRITSSAGADAGWWANLPVEPHSKYHLTVWVKTKGVQNSTGRGAQINLEGIDVRSDAVTGDSDWKQVGLDFETRSQSMVRVNCLFGGWGLSTGTADWDDMELTKTGTVTVPPLSIQVDAQKPLAPIKPEVYGQFLEHLGRCIYGGIWAEMLEDRKFFLPVKYDYAPYRRARAEEKFPALVGSPWKVVGQDGGVSSVADHTYREQPVVRVNPQRVKALKQYGLGFVAGKTYVGHVVARTPGGGILDLGIEQQGTTIKLGKEFTRTDFKFTAKVSSDDGEFTLAFRGSSPVDIAAVSLMPADNIEGFRADTIALLKRLDSPLYRWPGGNFVSGYEWRDGLGDQDRRPTRRNPAWTGIDTNDMGTHEFIRLCRIIKTNPLIVVNTGFGDPFSAGQWVEYCNGAPTTPMGKLRAAHGSPQPFKVHWWGVGNEMFGSWQLGYMDFGQYATKHNMTVDKMRRADSSIKLIASGEPGRFNDTIIPRCAIPGNLDLISAHFYCQTQPDVSDHVWLLRDGIRRTLAVHRTYPDKFPGLKGKNVPVCFDEWNYWYGPHVFGELGTRYFLKDGLGVAAGLHEFFRNSDLVEVAMYAQTVNVIGAIKTDRTAACMETTGLMLEMYRKYYGTVPVTLHATAEDNNLDVAAALTADGRYLTVGVVNPSDKEREVPFEVKGFVRSTADLHWVGGSDPNAYNDPQKPEVFTIKHGTLQAGQTLKVPPYTAMVARYKRLTPGR